MAPPSSKISGALVTSILSIKGVNASSITSICGIATSSIPGWPTGGGCITITLGYADLLSDPQSACEYYIGQPINYFYDTSQGILYGAGEACGGAYASGGYYSDGIDIYAWVNNEKSWTFTQIGTCG